MGIDESDKTVANLITDGCNMGIKSLNKYLNQYKMADEISKKVTNSEVLILLDIEISILKKSLITVRLKIYQKPLLMVTLKY